MPAKSTKYNFPMKLLCGLLMEVLNLPREGQETLEYF